MGRNHAVWEVERDSVVGEGMRNSTQPQGSDYDCQAVDTSVSVSHKCSLDGYLIHAKTLGSACVQLQLEESECKRGVTHVGLGLAAS